MKIESYSHAGELYRNKKNLWFLFEKMEIDFFGVIILFQLWYSCRKNRNTCKEEASFTEGFEPRFLDGWGGVLVYLIHTLNVGICPLKREVLNELIINYDILLFLYLLAKRLIVGKMEFPQWPQIPLVWGSSCPRKSYINAWLRNRDGSYHLAVVHDIR